MRIGDGRQTLDALNGAVEHAWRNRCGLAHVGVRHANRPSLPHVALLRELVEFVFESGDSSSVLAEGVDDLVHVFSQFFGTVWDGEVKVWGGDASLGLRDCVERCLGDIVCSRIAVEGTWVSRIRILRRIERRPTAHIRHRIRRRGWNAHTGSREKTAGDFSLKMKAHHGGDVSSARGLADLLSINRQS